MSSKQSAHFTMFSQTRVRFLNHKCALALSNSNCTQNDDTVTQTNRTEETMLFIYCAPSHSQSSKPTPASRSFFVWSIDVSLIYHDMRETKSSHEITGSIPLRRAVVIIDSSRLTASARWKPRFPTHTCGWAFQLCSCTPLIPLVLLRFPHSFVLARAHYLHRFNSNSQR